MMWSVVCECRVGWRRVGEGVGQRTEVLLRLRLLLRLECGSLMGVLWRTALVVICRCHGVRAGYVEEANMQMSVV